MHWNIIIPIFILIGDIFLAWFCYWLGCRSVKPIEDNNIKIEIRKRDLEDDILCLTNEKNELEERNKILDKEFEEIGRELDHAEQKRQIIDKENERALEFINQSEQLAKDRAQAIYEKEATELTYKHKKLEEDYQIIEAKLIQKIETEKAELKSLQETRAAAITAAQQEKHIQENKDYYCLILPQDELSDVNILRGVTRRISKPRSILMAIWQAYYQPLAKKKFPQILGKTDVCGIYKITNQETGECYIGQAVDVRKRWMDHCKMMLQIDAPKNNQLYMAAAEYGLDSFSFELLLECKPEELNAKEKYFIELYNSDAIGYNISSGKGN